MEINNVVIHKLIKEQNQVPSIVTRDTVLEVNENVSKLVTDIHDLYSLKHTKGYGRFEEDELNFPVAKILRSHLNDEMGFIPASHQMMTVLERRSGEEQFAKGGYVLMAHITNPAGQSWFLVAIINNIEGHAIDEETFDVQRAIHVELKDLRVAGRISVTDWLRNDPDVKYIGFLKKRGDVAGYFKSFLGCNDLLVNSVETKKLVEVVTKFAREEQMEDQAKTDFLRRVNDFCLEHSNNDRQISLTALANYAWPDDPDKLSEVFAREDVQISEGFVPDKRSLRSLIKINGKTDFWDLNLDRRALITGNAVYNSETGELTLRNLPQKMRNELDRELNDD